MANTLLQPYNIGTGVLGYSEASADGQSIGVGPTDVTGCSVAVTVNANVTYLKITGSVEVYNTVTGAGNASIFIKEGATILNQRQERIPDNVNTAHLYVEAIVSAPSTGSHTYKLAISSFNANTAVNSAATYKGFILVEAI